MNFVDDFFGACAGSDSLTASEVCCDDGVLTDSLLSFDRDQTSGSKAWSFNEWSCSSFDTTGDVGRLG